MMLVAQVAMLADVTLAINADITQTDLQVPTSNLHM